MSRRTRRRKEMPFSLFSFQDIMASVTGIVILVTLLLMLELIDREPKAAAAPPPDTIDAAAVEARLETLQEQLLAQPQVTPESIQAATEAAEAIDRLLAVLERRAAEAQEAASRNDEQATRLQAELSSLQEEAQTLQRRAELERSQTRVTLLDAQQGDKRSWFVECASDAVSVGRIDNAGLTRLERRFVGEDAVDRSLEWALSQPREAERFVLLVRPEGVEAFDRMQRVLRGAGYDVGWDLWTTSTRLFPQSPRESADGSPR